MSTHAAIAAHANRAVPGYLVSALAMTPTAGIGAAVQPRNPAPPALPRPDMPRHSPATHFLAPPRPASPATPSHASTRPA